MGIPAKLYHHSLKPSFRPAITLAAALSLVVISSAAQAENWTSDFAPVSVTHGATVTTTGYKKASLQGARKTYLGKARYICSPSGFGRTSSCKLRVSYN